MYDEDNFYEYLLWLIFPAPAYFLAALGSKLLVKLRIFKKMPDWIITLKDYRYLLKPEWLKNTNLKYEDLRIAYRDDMVILISPDETLLWSKIRRWGPFELITGYDLDSLVKNSIWNGSENVAALSLEGAPIFKISWIR